MDIANATACQFTVVAVGKEELSTIVLDRRGLRSALVKGENYATLSVCSLYTGVTHNKKNSIEILI